MITSRSELPVPSSLNSDDVTPSIAEETDEESSDDDIFQDAHPKNTASGYIECRPTFKFKSRRLNGPEHDPDFLEIYLKRVISTYNEELAETSTDSEKSDPLTLEHFRKRDGSGSLNITDVHRPNTYDGNDTLFATIESVSSAAGRSTKLGFNVSADNYRHNLRCTISGAPSGQHRLDPSNVIHFVEEARLDTATAMILDRQLGPELNSGEENDCQPYYPYKLWQSWRRNYLLSS